jgi:hypothetical protein
LTSDRKRLELRFGSALAKRSGSKDSSPSRSSSIRCGDGKRAPFCASTITDVVAAELPRHLHFAEIELDHRRVGAAADRLRRDRLLAGERAVDGVEHGRLSLAVLADDGDHAPVGVISTARNALKFCA